MKTITAVELRKNMGDVFARVQNGEEVRVTYRNSQPVLLAPVQQKTKKTTMTGLEALQKVRPKVSSLDPNKSIKELYHEMLDEKYGFTQK